MPLRHPIDLFIDIRWLQFRLIEIRYNLCNHGETWISRGSLVHCTPRAPGRDISWVNVMKTPSDPPPTMRALWTYLPGSSKKTIDQKTSTCPGNPRTPCLNVADHRIWMAGFAKHCCHTTLKLGDRGCLTLLARLQVGWLFFEEPGINQSLTS